MEKEGAGKATFYLIRVFDEERKNILGESVPLPQHAQPELKFEQEVTLSELAMQPL